MRPSFRIDLLSKKCKHVCFDPVGSGTVVQNINCTARNLRIEQKTPYRKYQGTKNEVHNTGLTPKLAKWTNSKQTKQVHTLPCLYKSHNNLTLPMQ